MFRLVYGSEGVHDMCDYKAGVEKKFLRTETSASMKPMLGPVRVSCCATCLTYRAQSGLLVTLFLVIAT